MPLPEILVEGEKLLVQGHRQALVASKSVPGDYHTVSWEWNDETGREEWVCTCMGFSVRHACRHVRVVDRWNAGKTVAVPLEEDIS